MHNFVLPFSYERLHMSYIPRALETEIEKAFRTHPVIILTGPRQVGKSTLLENAKYFKPWHYLTLDDADVLDQAREDPKGLLNDERPTILDEVQRHALLFLTIKYYVDRSKGKRQFVLSGSGNISLRESPRESLAGRARYLHLSPFSLSEQTKREPPRVLQQLLSKGRLTDARSAPSLNYLETTWRGGLPKVVLTRSRKKALEILASYVDTYLQRDIQDLVRVRYPEHFRRLMMTLAKATGWESNQEELSKICGEERSNVSRYITLLKETGLLYEIRGYTSAGEKAYRQAKYYWFDSGVACFLSGIYSPAALKDGKLKGRYFENLIFQQLLFFLSLQWTPSQIFYWKSKNGAGEIDFILKQGENILPLEIKSSKTLTFRDTAAIRNFLKTHPEARCGAIIYTGSQVYPIATNIYAIPWTEV